MPQTPPKMNDSLMGLCAAAPNVAKNSAVNITDDMVLAAWVLMVAMFVVSTGTLGVFRWNQSKHQRLRVRPLVLNVFFVLGVWSMAIGSLLPIVTRTTQPCWVTTIAVTFQIPFMHAFIAGRIFVMAFQYGFAKAAVADADERRAVEAAAAASTASSDDAMSHAAQSAVTNTTSPFASLVNGCEAVFVALGAVRRMFLKPASSSSSAMATTAANATTAATVAAASANAGAADDRARNRVRVLRAL